MRKCEMIFAEIIPLPADVVTGIPRDESWREIMDHCLDHDPLPWSRGWKDSTEP